MRLFISKLFLLLRQSALLVLYAAFFLVQFFCITGSDNTAIPGTSLSHYKEPAKEKVFNVKNNRDKKTKIRLNKRFQPAIADRILSAGENVPVKYISFNSSANPKDYILISIVLAASLRGPPALS